MVQFQSCGRQGQALPASSAARWVTPALWLPAPLPRRGGQPTRPPCPPARRAHLRGVCPQRLDAGRHGRLAAAAHAHAKALLGAVGGQRIVQDVQKPAGREVSRRAGQPSRSGTGRGIYAGSVGRSISLPTHRQPLACAHVHSRRSRALHTAPLCAGAARASLPLLRPPAVRLCAVGHRQLAHIEPVLLLHLAIPAGKVPPAHTRQGRPVNKHPAKQAAAPCTLSRQ